MQILDPSHPIPNADTKPRLLAVVGPTAGGKSALALSLAKCLSGEIVSCDSMQVYRIMDIGTAKPSMEEQRTVRHHMIDIVDPTRPFSCADYVARAKEVIADIHERGKLPILCGGTGLYSDALLRGGFEETAASPELRESLLRYAEEYGNRALHERLAAVDPESAAAIHENNVKRVTRALEIFESTGMTKTEFDRRSLTFERPYRATVFGLFYPTREILYERIDRRVEEMIASGLLQETRMLRDAGVFKQNATAAQAIGYKELLGVLDGSLDQTTAVENLKRATRRYAKRQITWFSAKADIIRLNMTQDGKMRPARELIDEILSYIREEST